jgi:hypothetical protein
VVISGINIISSFTVELLYIFLKFKGTVAFEVYKNRFQRLKTRQCLMQKSDVKLSQDFPLTGVSSEKQEG